MHDSSTSSGAARLGEKGTVAQARGLSVPDATQPCESPTVPHILRSKCRWNDGLQMWNEHMDCLSGMTFAEGANADEVVLRPRETPVRRPVVWKHAALFYPVFSMSRKMVRNFHGFAVAAGADQVRVYWG
ncbi:uncharacterized protein [Physcomitrium patens]|uniref:Uncharacterized protein n=1 Tax=Physcomitrium patens TaxID=3218 RepID=A0A7I3ZTL5_PHYPA